MRCINHSIMIGLLLALQLPVFSAAANPAYAPHALGYEVIEHLQSQYGGRVLRIVTRLDGQQIAHIMKVDGVVIRVPLGAHGPHHRRIYENPHRRR